MDTIFRGDLATARGRRNAWADALFVDHALLRLAWTNFATVVPGRLYRSNHPTPARLAAQVRRHGIRTVLNLRGACGNGSDALSRAAARALGVTVVDVAFKSSRAPERATLLALIAALRHAAEPILVHCKSGADRAGFAAGVFLLLQGRPAATALAQMSLRHGHLRHSRTGILDAVFRRYQQDAEGRLDFAAWVDSEYAPDTVRRSAGLLSDFVQSALRRE